MRRTTACVATCWLVFLVVPAVAQDDLIQKIRDVGPNGGGHAEAQAALQELRKADASVLPQILRAFDDAGPLPANWLRGAFESIADRQARNDKALPTKALLAFVKDTKRDGRARRLAYDWLIKSKPEIADELIPGMLHDPSPEFRRDAVARLVESASKALDAGRSDQARKLFEEALTGAVHDDQVRTIVEPLKELGVTVDLQKHFGFLPEWSLVGPFDNSGGDGFEASYPPEDSVDLNASYEGQNDKTVKWQRLSTDDQYGLIDIADQIENYKGSCMYATTNVVVTSPQELELRLATPNAWKLWVNGELVFGREEYHRTPQNVKMDHYRVPVQLKPGRNSVLLKICQNEQEESWAQRYQFKVRVCDATGAGVPLATELKTSQRLPANRR